MKSILSGTNKQTSWVQKKNTSNKEHTLMISSFAIYSWNWKGESIVQKTNKQKPNSELQTKNIIETGVFHPYKNLLSVSHEMALCWLKWHLWILCDPYLRGAHQLLIYPASFSTIPHVPTYSANTLNRHLTIWWYECYNRGR